MYIYLYLNIHIYSLMSGSFPCFSAPPISKYQGIPNQIHPNSPNSKQLKPKPTQSQTENQKERSELHPNPNPTIHTPVFFFKIWNSDGSSCTIPSICRENASWGRFPTARLHLHPGTSTSLARHTGSHHLREVSLEKSAPRWNGLSTGDVGHHQGCLNLKKTVGFCWLGFRVGSWYQQKWIEMVWYFFRDFDIDKGVKVWKCFNQWIQLGIAQRHWIWHWIVMDNGQLPCCWVWYSW